MALTSVVPSYPPTQQSNEFPAASFGLAPYTNFAHFNLSHGNQFNFVNSSDVQANLLVSSGTIPPATFYSQNGYFAIANDIAGPESFRFIQPPTPAMLNAFHGQQMNINRDYCTQLASLTSLTPTTPPLTNAIDSGQLSNNKSTMEFTNDQAIAFSDDNASVENGPNVTNNQTSILIIRLLMSGKEVGSIIGKRGENVKKYREKSGARINISDGSSPERIVTITGTADQICVAFTLMSQKFEDDFTQGILRMGDEGPSCPPVILRLLVPVTQCGSIIGKGGSRIKDVRELTGASIQVASAALPSSTERTVTISGTAKAIAKCIEHLCEIFMESPAKGPVVPYRPKPAFNGQAINGQAIQFPTTIVPHTMPFPVGSADCCPENVYSNPNTNQNVLFNSNNVAATETPMPAGQSFLDPNHLSSAIGYSDLPVAHANALLNTLHSAGLVTGPLSRTLLNPSTFALPGLQPGMLGLCTPHTFPGLGNNGNYVFAGTPSLLSSPTETREDNMGLSHNDSSNGLAMVTTTLPFAPNGGIAGTSLPSMNQIPNKASLLGLPVMPSILNTNPVNSMYGNMTLCNEPIIKEIVISNELIGCIIGKGGATVNEIRNISKAHVKISNCEDGTKERKITLSGSPQAVNMAQFLINNRISAELFAGMIAFVSQ